MISQLILSENNLSGSASGNYSENNFQYTSTFDPISNLYAKYCFDNGFKNRPIVLLQHGLGNDAESISQANMRRYASYGFFVLSVGLRMNNGASGMEDNGGRDILDIFDAINYIKLNFKSKIDKTKTCIIGFSNGCANVYNLCSKFPDLFNHVVGYFGISDYGYIDSTGWWYQKTDTFTRGLIQRIGGTPTTIPNKYRTRYAIEGFINYLGEMNLYHDVDDSTVPVNQSQLMVNQYPTKIIYKESNSSSVNRFLHGYPDSPGQLSSVETEFINKLKTKKELKIMGSGSFKIMGYLITKKFKIFINDGTDTVANLIYNLGLKTFDIEPLTGNGSCTIQITLNNITTTININNRTIIQL